MEQGNINGGASLLNSYAAADIDVTTLPGFLKIPGLNPIPLLSYSGYTKTVSATEVRQVRTIGVAPSAVPVIVAETPYQIMVGNDGIRDQNGSQNALRPVGYTSPASLSGSAAYDRHLAYASIAGKINADSSFFMTAYPVITVAQTNTTPFAVGEIVTETVSGATGINLSGTTGTLTIAVTGGTWSGLVTGTATAGTLTGSIAGLSTSTAHVTVAGFGLRMIDTAGYYPVNGKRNRLGANTILLTKGWTPMATYMSNTPDALHTINAVYAFGQGSALLQMVPVQNSTDTNLAKGTINFPTNNAPVSTNVYTHYQIRSKPLVADDVMGGSAGRYYLIQELWLNEGDADYAATVTAINNLTPAV